MDNTEFCSLFVGYLKQKPSAHIEYYRAKQESEKAICRQLNLTSEASSKITDAAFPYFASVMLPDCGYPELMICSKWMIWIFLFDDEFDNGDLKNDPEKATARMDQLKATMTDTSFDCRGDEMMSIHLEMWNAIKQKDLDTGEKLIQNRYRRAMFGYCDGVLSHVQSSSGRDVPVSDDYLEARRLSSGCEPLFALVEYAYGLKIPDSQFYELDLTRLKEISVEIALLHNDMISWHKEKSEGVPHNYVVSLTHYENISQSDALEIIRKTAIRQQDLLSETAQRLFHPKNEDSLALDRKRYIEGVLRVPMANLWWSHKSKRYF